MTSTILFVCTANLCRSPMAQGLAAMLVQDLTQGAQGTSSGEHATGGQDRLPALNVGSAGVAARDGSPLHPLAAGALERRESRCRASPAGCLRPAHIHGADLVITATRAHRAHCARLVPSATRRCFTLAQLSRLATVMESDGLAPRGRADHGPSGSSGSSGTRQSSGPSTPSGLAALLAAVPVARARLQPVSPDEDDLADPVLAGQQAFEDCAETIQRLLAPPLRLICS